MTTVKGYFKVLRGRPGKPDKAQPYISAILELTRLNVQAPISFLIDTGADVTTLHSGDALNMGVPLGPVPNIPEEDVLGVGGLGKYRVEEGIIRFGDRQIKQKVLVGPIHDPPKTIALTRGFPSLIGMDVIQSCDLRINYIADDITVTVHGNFTAGMARYGNNHRPRRRQKKRP